MPAAPDRVGGLSEAWQYAIKSFALWPQSEPPLLNLGWTLIHEMWFYIVFAALLILPRRFLTYGLIVWGSLVLARFTVWGAVGTSLPVWKLVTSPLTLEFIGGALMAKRLLRRSDYPKPLVWGVICLAVIWLGLAMIFDFQFKAKDPHFVRLVVYGPAMIALVWASTVLFLQNRFAVPRWLTRLGDWSYSLYLIHYIVLIGTKRILQILGLDDLSGPVPVIIFGVFVLVLSLVTAGILYKFFERPMMNLFRRSKDRLPEQKSG